eukprot:5894708-Pleurochrysis_carterae.AAC.1
MGCTRGSIVVVSAATCCTPRPLAICNTLQPLHSAPEEAAVLEEPNKAAPLRTLVDDVSACGSLVALA